jgi:hypothetical protein
MKAIKENRVYTITDAEKDAFQKEGYDIYSDNGEVIAYGFGKTVPYEKYAKLVKQVEELQEEIHSLKESKKKKG